MIAFVYRSATDFAFEKAAADKAEGGQVLASLGLAMN